MLFYGGVLGCVIIYHHPNLSVEVAQDTHFVSFTKLWESKPGSLIACALVSRSSVKFFLRCLGTFVLLRLCKYDQGTGINSLCFRQTPNAYFTECRSRKE